MIGGIKNDETNGDGKTTSSYHYYFRPYLRNETIFFLKLHFFFTGKGYFLIRNFILYLNFLEKIFNLISMI